MDSDCDLVQDALDDVMDCGCSSGSCYCDEDSPSPYGDDDYAPELEVTFAKREAERGQ